MILLNSNSDVGVVDSRAVAVDSQEQVSQVTRVPGADCLLVLARVAELVDSSAVVEALLASQVAAAIVRRSPQRDRQSR